MEPTKLSNAAIARLLREVAASYEIKNENRFKIRAYDTAADSVEHATSEVKDLWEEGRLGELPGVGESISSHLDEYFRTGKVKHFEDVKKGLPSGMFAVFGLEGVGPKRAYRLAQKLKVKTIADLYQAAKAGAIEKMEGFGHRSQELILKAIEGRQQKGQRILLPVAFSVAERLIEQILLLPGVVRADPLGSLRRMVSTVGDIDIGVATTKPQEVVKEFTSLPDVGRVVGAGEAKATVVLKTGRQVDIRVHDPRSYGALLQYFTGSKAHNIHLRKIANEKGYSLSEYGISKFERGEKIGKPLPVEAEEEFYRLLGLPWIPPELREDTGEIEAAQTGKLPDLVSLDDVQGEIHVHTNHSDGEETTESMVEEALRLGRKYVGISDHAPSIITRGWATARDEVKRRKEEVERLRDKFKGRIGVFFGAEVNIDSQAKMALPDELLAFYEYTIGSIHTSFDQPKEMTTKRLLTALANPYVNVLGHPMGRLLGEREAYEVDWKTVFAAAEKHDKVLEINSYPSRLDLPDGLVRTALKQGIRFVISTDVHRHEHFRNLRFGVAVARRGWCEKSDIINANEADQFAKLIKVRR
ncbi:MAG: DNA polymerase/3'-5' exonuclease PolX [candidate division WWE3 bacterium]|nr:DNA polymerase/3'-5' exonuclease PolX [candidate division WWE3 bacterium]